MNRANAELYGPKEASADFVKDLVSKGAVIIGKTKLCAFASAEEPTDQWIDYHCPFDPRGDGYQSPSGSTTGGAAALAGYPWLDVSIGTDSMYMTPLSRLISHLTLRSNGEHQSSGNLLWAVCLTYILRLGYNERDCR
jgi:hypothetical protein